MTPHPFQPAVLLNVDDNEPARYARSRILEQAGFNVHEAATGSDALRLVDELRPDMVLLDVNLPDLNGIEVCRQIKAHGDTAAIIVLQISASGTSAPHPTAALNTGDDSCLTEPVDPNVLIATVRALLRVRAAERALAAANKELSWKNAELEELNQTLKRSNEDLQHFAYIASHDLQEPLRTICTHVQLLDALAASRFDKPERELFTSVVDAALRMSMLIRDVLAYARIGEEAAPLVAMPLSAAVESALMDLSESVAITGAIVEVAGDLPNVQGDSSQLSRVLQNLVGNALKYRKPAITPYIRITADPPANSFTVIHVSDNGIGIADEYLEKIFFPFKRLHGREIPGSGIGLAICRRIVEGHGGRIWAESRPELGSKFSFTLRLPWEGPVGAHPRASQANDTEVSDHPAPSMP
ncbi:MAG TPA: ATP-binding protein [Bryobacteraceae bacterium]|nr:ATP-binding protein [Bryobacteraceae bacterium]